MPGTGQDPRADAAASFGDAASWRLAGAGRVLVGPRAQVMPLTRGESRLLQALLDKPGRPMSREEYPHGGRALDVAVARLRAKAVTLGVSLPLLTVREWGYMFLPRE